MGRKKKLPDQLEAGIEVFSYDENAPVAGKSLSSKVEKLSTESGPKKRPMIMDLRIQTPSSLAHVKVEGVDTAPALIRIAKVKGLDMIAITDLHSAGSVDNVINAATNSGITVIPGLTLRCALPPCEDLTLIVLFPETYRSADLENFLVAVGVSSEKQGNPNLIIEKSFAEVLSTIRAHGGIAIPTRLDRTPQQQQIIPRLVEEYKFRVFDLAHEESAEIFKARWPEIRFRLFSFSNASVLAQVGSRIAKIRMDAPGFIGIKEAIERLA